MKPMLRSLLKNFSGSIASIKWDLKRLRVRVKSKVNAKYYSFVNKQFPDKLHIGCGKRKINNWLNVDIAGSDFDLDIASGKLPFKDQHFSAIASQHVIEHLYIHAELIPLLKEVSRCLKPGGEAWLSCPDIEKIAKSYLKDQGESLLKDRQVRFPGSNTTGLPASHMVNMLFHQSGQHKNLFDFNLLSHVLQISGFDSVKMEDETSFLQRFPEFPKRNDDLQTLYVSARRNP